MRAVSIAWLLAFALSSPAGAQISMLQIKVVEGEGSVYEPGTRATRPLTVEVTDETGHPVAGAAVGFHFPGQGPSGVFFNGLRTDLMMTDANGRASIRGFRLNRAVGSFQIRVTASKDQARAGIVSSQRVAGPGNAAPAATMAPHASDGSLTPGERTPVRPRAVTRSPSSRKWVVLSLVVAGAAAGGAVAWTRNSSSGLPATAAAATQAALSVGNPMVTIVKP